jgi:putative membrane protein
MRLIARLLINALALWLTTLIVTGVRVVPFEPGELLQTVLTYLIVAAIFGIVNAVVGNFIRIVAFPIYILTLGLIALVVNGLLLLLAAWITGLLGFGLEVDGFWWGVLGALVLGLISWLIGILTRPLIGGAKSSR